MIWYGDLVCECMEEDWGFGVERNKRRDLIYGEICLFFFFLSFFFIEE